MDPFYEVEKDAYKQLDVLNDFIDRQSDNISNDIVLDFNNNKSELLETINDLKESVDTINQNPDLYSSIDANELKKRSESIQDLRRKLSQLNSKWAEKLNKSKREVTTMSNRISQEFDQEDHQSSADAGGTAAGQQYQHFQQQELIREQDYHLDNIHQTMQNLHMQASTMGDELEDQHVILQQFDNEMDTMGTKLHNGLKRVDYFLAKNKDKASDCCIVLLVAALVILLLILIVL
ncbi:hypothetical protein PACTADRAFT_49212 [Pachysolen tannophilus NRRL Y-2460]|uniref:t-SNARE affecting a late Golgi compartment protein 1 n=1 Tax=Pachysolen tannophilus NRRL Y-2460 TaxID=669874 RepID=A0A1E4TVK5_PACTA|nr:hypothetical protein PACTADRAFT_49212 [Pachysolen tannophilus NRRL Y-2460]